MKQTGNTERCFVIGDIHGCAKTFRKLLLEELKIATRDVIICVGDYIDRGPSSKEVIDFILELKNDNYNIVTLRGNHEQLFIDSPRSVEDFNVWFNNGGGKTLDSFEVYNYKNLDEKYRGFLEQTIFYTSYKNYLIVHAGFSFEEEDYLEDKSAMLWIRDMEIDNKKLGDKIIIHGHTPTTVKKLNSNIKEIQYSKELNIDTGCVYQHAGYNYLTAVELNTLQLTSIQNIDQ